MNSFQIGMNLFRLIFFHSATVNCARQKRQWHCVFALLGYLQPAAKLVTGHWWQGTWGQVALTHADTISTQYLHKFIAKFCRHIYQILSIIYYLHTLCSRGAPGLRQVTWWCVSRLLPAAPRHAPSATIYWAHISSLHRYSRHYKFKLNFHERFHVHIQPQWIHVLILWSYHWKVNVKFIEQIQNNIFKWNTFNNKYINAFWHLVCCPPWPVSGYVSWLFLQA